MYIITAENKITKHHLFFFCEEYIVDKNGLEVTFDGMKYYLPNLEVLNDTEQEVHPASVMFNKEYLTNYIESEGIRPMTVQEAGRLSRRNPSEAQRKASEINGAKNKGKKGGVK